MRGRSEYKRIWKFFGILIGICLLLLVVLIVFSGSSRLENITVEGNSYYTDEEIIERVVTEPTDQFTLLLYLRCRYQEMDRIPFVEYVDVKMEDKNTAVFTVYEKIITGCVKIMGNYLYFDKDGIVVESSSSKREEIPIITGLNFDQLILYEELKVQKEGMFTTILNLTRLIDKYGLSVEEIRFHNDLEVDFICGNIRVKLGKKEMYDEPAAALVNILPQVQSVEKKMVIDMTNYMPGERIIGTYEE